MEEFFSSIAKRNFFLNALILGRPWNAFLIGFFSLIGFLQLAKLTNFSLTLSIFLSFFLQYFGGSILNDIYDFSADKINMPYRPLESGVISIQQAKMIMFLSFFLSFVLAYFTSPYLLIGVLLFFLITILYSVKPFRLVSKGFIGNLSLAVVTILVPSLTGMAVANKNFFVFGTDFYLPFFSFTLFFAFFSIIKDFKDIKGDSNTGKKTFVVVHGLIDSAKVMLFGSVLFFIISAFYFGKLVFFVEYYYILSFVFLIFLLYLELSAFDINKSHEDFEKMFLQGRLLLFFYVSGLLLLFL